MGMQLCWGCACRFYGGLTHNHAEQKADRTSQRFFSSSQTSEQSSMGLFRLLELIGALFLLGHIDRASWGTVSIPNGMAFLCQVWGSAGQIQAYQENCRLEAIRHLQPGRPVVIGRKNEKDNEGHSFLIPLSWCKSFLFTGSSSMNELLFGLTMLTPNIHLFPAIQLRTLRTSVVEQRNDAQGPLGMMARHLEAKPSRRTPRHGWRGDAWTGVPVWRFAGCSRSGSKNKPCGMSPDCKYYTIYT